MKQNKIQKEIQWQHASRSIVLQTGNWTSRPSHTDYLGVLPVPYQDLLWYGIHARMLQDKMIVKIKRGLSFYKLVSLANKI